MSIKEIVRDDLLERFELRGSFVKVDTSIKKMVGFKAMAFNQIRVPVDVDAILSKTLEQVLSYISAIVQDHYKKHNGFLIIIGDILGYSFEYKNHTYRFSIDGKLIEEV